MDPREPDGAHLGRGLTRRGGESILRAVHLGKRMSHVRIAGTGVGAAWRP